MKISNQTVAGSVQQQNTATHPFPGVPSPQFLQGGLPECPEKSDVHREVEAKDP